MTARESVRAKAVRLLADGKLRVCEMSGGRVQAEITGDHGTYRVGYHPRVRGSWFCNCPYRNREIPGRPGEFATCSHMLALTMVISVDRLAGQQMQLAFA